MDNSFKTFLFLVSILGITTNEMVAKRALQETTEATPAPEAKRGRIQCTICQDDIEEPHKLDLKFSCYHTFHEKCITPWLQQKGDFTPCPTCRAALRVLTPSIENLQRAIIDDNMSLVKNIIAAQRASCDSVLGLIRTPDGNGTTPLMFAFQRSHTNIINFLINVALGEEENFLEFVNTRDRAGRNALIYAMRGHSRLNVINFIIQKALETGNSPALWRIICCNDTIDSSPFYQAISNKQIQITSVFIEALQHTTTIENEEIGWYAALFLAIANNKEDPTVLDGILTSLSLYQQHQPLVDINIWQSALIIALRQNNLDALEELIYAASHDGHSKQRLLTQGSGTNVILAAVESMDRAAVELFINLYVNEISTNLRISEALTDPHPQLDWRFKLLKNAYLGSNPEIFEADANDYNSLPTTLNTLLIALRLAVANHNYETIDQIIFDATFRYSTDPNRFGAYNIVRFLMARDRNGDTSLTIANNPTIIASLFTNLLEAKGNIREFVKIANNEGDTALTIFSRKGLVEGVRLILINFPESTTPELIDLIHKTNMEGKTALTIAESFDDAPHMEIAQLLRDYLTPPSFEAAPE